MAKKAVKSTQKVWAAWADDFGFELGSFGPTKRSVVTYMVASERQWLLDDEEYSDSQIWRRARRHGWQVVRASLSRC